MTRRDAGSGLEPYVSRIAAEWEQVNGARRWRELDGSLCFIDISGFTMLSERLAARGHIGAEELTDVLSRVFSSMIELAYDRGAVQLKFGGDALLLLFESADHPAQAAAAAVEMRSALRETATWPTSVGRLRLKMSVGIHSGTVQLFRVGSSHQELIVAGPAASTTAEMEAVAEAGEIVVSDATRQRLPAGAVGAATGAGWRLRWRRPPVEPSGPIPRQARTAEQLLVNVPVALRAHLGPGGAEPEHRAASIAFVKFTGVDRLLAAEGPDAVADALEQVVSAVQRAADEESVTFLASDLDRDGGKVILTAGVPTSTEDDAGRLLRAIRRLADHPTPLPLRIGVNRGHVFAGDVGSSTRRSTYTVMGDTVNVAARLMAAAPPGSIYAMPVVLDGSRTLFEATALEPLTVKGKEAAILAYEVGEEIGGRADVVDLETPFVGRSSEVDQLDRALEQLSVGVGGVVAVRGPAGIGKTRLVHHALSLRPQLQAVTFAAEPFRSATSYRPLRDTFRRMLGIVRSDPEYMADQLRVRIAELDAELLPMLPLIGEVTHIDMPPTPEVAAIEPRFRPDRVALVVEHLLLLLRPGPLVVVAEDAHWMDEPTAQLLERLAAATAAEPWLVIALRRDDEGGFAPEAEIDIGLARLAHGEAEALALLATASAPLRPHDLERVLHRAAGNPLHLEEIIRAVRDVGTVDALPESLDAVMNAQIDALPPLSRSVLRCAAVLGGSFRRVVFEDMLVRDGTALEETAWEDLDRFVEPTEDDRYRFRHAVLRDAAYEALPYRRRRELHLRAGEATEQAAGEHPEAVADLLALHYARGQDHERAWRFGRVAGDRATDAFANVEAATNYELALEAARSLTMVPDAERAEVWEQLGSVREQAGLFTLALDAFRRASALVRGDPMAEAQLFLERARALERAGSYSQALRETTLGLQRVAESPDPGAPSVVARLLALVAIVRQAQERPRLALAAAQRAAEAAEKADEPRALARAYGVLDWAYSMLGQRDRARHGPAALRIYEDLGDLPGQAVVMNNLGVEAYFDGRWAEAVDLYERTRTAFLEAGNAVQAAIAGANLGELLVNQDRLDEAEPFLRDSARVLRASEFVDGALFAEIQVGRLLMAQGRIGEAAEVLEAAAVELTEMRLHGSAYEAAMYLAECSIRVGEPARALDLLATGSERAGEEAELLETQAARVRALALVELGREGDARAELAPAIALARDQGLAYELSRLLVVRADLDRRTGRSLDSTDPTEAAEIAEGLGLRQLSGQLD